MGQHIQQEKTQKRMTTLIYNANIKGNGIGWVLIDGERISQIGKGVVGDLQADTIIDAEGKLLLPGAIDCHVHFREPGLTHKATIASESSAAIAGGVTSYIDMPNCVPTTTTNEALEQKMRLAAETSSANYAFFIGATDNNLDQLLNADYTKVAGVKLFLGSSTGNMLVNDSAALHTIFEKVRVPIVVHAEDEDTIKHNRAEYIARYGCTEPPVEAHSLIRSTEACVKATERAISLAKEHNAHLHIAHLTTAAELNVVQKAGPNVTCEVSPHHLLWCDEDYATRGTRIKMNPAVKTSADREALRNAVRTGIVDIVATDHAPHLLDEKQGGAITAVSGAPLVQFSLPVMLDMFSPDVVVRTMCQGPAKLFGIIDRGDIAVGNYADLVIVSESDHKVTDADVVSKCGWTPLNGLTLHHRIDRVFVNGKTAYDNGIFANANAMPLQFSRQH
jgi:dihydroorotase